mmetsp:Transcript_5802/g.8363  ORF Transcript_5802/g.8363 Transcript_5802/m.8363 type:complete len:93 (+) Transcript_5802:202-480(+)
MSMKNVPDHIRYVTNKSGRKTKKNMSKTKNFHLDLMDMHQQCAFPFVFGSSCHMQAFYFKFLPLYEFQEGNTGKETLELDQKLFFLVVHGLG